jgi:hypothetical protein
MASVFFVPGLYRELKKLRESGYALKVLVRTFAMSGVVLTTNSLATYIKSLALPKERPQTNVARTGTVAAPTVQLRTEHFQMKADIPRQERSNVWQGFSL